MGRQARIIAQSSIYHIIFRSVNGQIIFEDALDYQQLIKCLLKTQEKYKFEIYAYCLMSNHIHLILDFHGEKPGIPMSVFATSFVRWYNAKYQRKGHLFQDRFRSIPIENDIQFLQTLYYIHENPVKANLCRFASEYYWSSHHTYYSTKESFINTQKAIQIAGSRELLHQFFSRHKPLVAEEELQEILPFPNHLLDETALKIFKNTTGCKSPSDFQNLPRTTRNQYIRTLYKQHLTQKQIALFGGLSRMTVYRVLKG